VTFGGGGAAGFGGEQADKRAARKIMEVNFAANFIAGAMCS
jgi:hypothetical protein